MSISLAAVRFHGFHQVEDPTVINPEKYKVRFRKAMDRYFMVAPDRNAHLPEIEQNDQGPGVND